MFEHPAFILFCSIINVYLLTKFNFRCYEKEVAVFVYTWTKIYHLTLFKCLIKKSTISFSFLYIYFNLFPICYVSRFLCLTTSHLFLNLSFTFAVSVPCISMFYAISNVYPKCNRSISFTQVHKCLNKRKVVYRNSSDQRWLFSILHFVPTQLGLRQRWTNSLTIFIIWTDQTHFSHLL